MTSPDPWWQRRATNKPFPTFLGNHKWSWMSCAGYWSLYMDSESDEYPWNFQCVNESDCTCPIHGTTR